MGRVWVPELLNELDTVRTGLQVAQNMGHCPIPKTKQVQSSTFPGPDEVPVTLQTGTPGLT